MMPHRRGAEHQSYKHGGYVGMHQRWSEASERAHETGVDCIGRRFVPTRTQHSTTLDVVILDHVDRRYPRSSRAIYDRVVSDYGSVGIRVFYRHLGKLREAGKIRIARREPCGGYPQLFYVKAGSPSK